VRTWAKEAWNAATERADVRYLIREMVAFVRAQAAFGTSLAERREPLPDVAAQSAGLELSVSETDIKTLPFEPSPARSR